MSKIYPTRVLETCYNGDAIVEIPDELLAELDWREGDTVHCETQGDSIVVKNLTINRTVFSDVAKFMMACGQTLVTNNPVQASLYKKLIDEEYDEFIQAIMANDEVEQIDACFDMIWVIIGYMLSKGWNCPAIWQEGSKSNHAKIDKVTGVVLKREDGKVMKPEGWQPPNFSKFASK